MRIEAQENGLHIYAFDGVRNVDMENRVYL